MNTCASTQTDGRACRQALRSTNLKALAAGLALAVGLQSVAAAQPATQAPATPPSGQYAPPPTGEEASGSTYDRGAQDADRAYADQYSRWAAQYCVDKRNNEVAGTAIGGVLGAILGSGLAGRGARKSEAPWWVVRSAPPQAPRSARTPSPGRLALRDM